MFVVRLLLSFLIVVCGSVVGLHLSSRLHRREEVLHSFQNLFTSAMSRIEYSGDDLCAVFSGNFAGFVFTRERSFMEQWQQLVNVFSGVLKSQDIEMLSKIADDLGTTDTDSQLSLLQLYIKETESLLTKAKSDNEQRGKLCRTLPVAVAVVIAILLI